MTLFTIRAEESGDEAAIRLVNEQAFGQPTEAQIVDCLRQTCPELRSLVALVDGQIIGHLLLTPAVIEQEGRSVMTGMGLAPLAVLPTFQRQGVGTQLVRHGLESVQQAGCPFVIVLGHPAYYGRFGFVPASRYGVVCEYPDVPDEAFMLLAFDPSTMTGMAGVAKYRPEFATAV